MHSVSNLSHIEFRFAAFKNSLKGLTIQQPQAFQNTSITCSHYQSLDYTLTAYPYYAHPSSTGTEKVRKAYQRPRNDLVVPTYNLGW